ncbi:hypothetical protein Tco_1473323 [Tanacetum coccineum]
MTCEDWVDTRLFHDRQTFFSLFDPQNRLNRYLTFDDIRRLSLVPILNSLRPFKQPYKPCSLRFVNRFAKNSGMVLDRLNDSGENPPPVTIHTWLERFNKQNPHSFDNAAAPKDAENRISHLEEILMFSRQETQESVVMLPEIASSTARLATSSKMTRRTLRQVHLVTLTRKPDAFGRVFAITQNQTTDISSTITDASLILELQCHVVPAEGISMGPAKVEAVTKWPRPTSETEARSFLKLAGHYHRVVEVFSLLALPLTKLTRKDEKLYGPKSKRRSLKNEIVQLHGTPSAIVSDKDPRFTFRILETHTRQEGYTNKLSRPLKLSAKLSCFLESIAYEWRQTSHKYHSFHDVSYPHDQIHEDLSHLNEPEAILNCQDRVREEFRDGIGPFNDSGENPPPVTIHTWLERFNKQNPHSFDNAAAPKDAENRISHLEEILMFYQNKVWLCNKFEYDELAWWKAYEQLKIPWNFSNKSIHRHLMCILFIDIAQFADVAHNLEILHDTEDYDGSEQSGKK